MLTSFFAFYEISQIQFQKCVSFPPDVNFSKIFMTVFLKTTFELNHGENSLIPFWLFDFLEMRYFRMKIACWFNKSFLDVEYSSLSPQPKLQKLMSLEKSGNYILIFTWSFKRNIHSWAFNQFIECNISAAFIKLLKHSCCTYL